MRIRKQKIFLTQASWKVLKYKSRNIVPKNFPFFSSERTQTTTKKIHAFLVFCSNPFFSTLDISRILRRKKKSLFFSFESESNFLRIQIFVPNLSLVQKTTGEWKHELNRECFETRIGGFETWYHYFCSSFEILLMLWLFLTKCKAC